MPTRILVHGYVTVEGRKIGKSAGNAIDPVPLAEELGPDALRYFLLRHIRSTGDGDFSYARFRQAYDSELAGQLGNLAHRVLSMIERYCDGVVPTPSEGFVESDRLLQAANRLPDMVAAHLHAFAFDRAIDDIWAFVADANRYVSEKAPWDLAKVAASPDGEAAAAGEAKLHDTLLSLSASLLAIAKCIAPLLPRASRKLFKKFGNQHFDSKTLAGTRVAAGIPLFPKP
ncbi:methionyl-tRNA synthetase [Rhodoligotrophos appendicifer]